MYIKCVLFSIVLFSSFLSNAYASHRDHDLWKNTIELGGSVETGNNPSRTVLGKFKSDLDIKYPDHPWGYSYALEGRRSTARGIETARRVRTHGEGRYLFSKRTYVFGKVNYVYNAFDTYDIVVRDSGGLGYILFDTPKQKLTVEAGPGGTHQRIAGSKIWQNQFIAHGEANYILHLGETAEFKQDLIVDAGDLNTYFRAVSSITTTITSNLNLRFSFESDHNSTIPASSSNTQHTDTVTSVTLLYCF